MATNPFVQTITINNDPVITRDSARADYIVDCGRGNLTRYSNLEDAQTHECPKVTFPVLNIERGVVSFAVDPKFPTSTSGDLVPQQPAVSPIVQAIPRTQPGHKVWPIFASLALIGSASYFTLSRNKQ